LAKVMLVAEELLIGTRQDGCRKHPEDWRRKSVWISDS
jgi:hypothetical protein